MSRAVLVLHTDAIRERAIQWIRGAPKDTRVTFEGPKRTLPQNAKLWALLSDVARQKEHAGRKYDTVTWKSLFMHAFGIEVKWIPSLDGESVVPVIYRSSQLTKREMSDLIEWIISWGAQNGVIFSDQPTPRDDTDSDI